MPKYYDLHVDATKAEEVISLAEGLGWSGVCLTTSDTKKRPHIASDKLEVFWGVTVSAKSEAELKKKSREAIDSADLVLFEGGGEVNRLAAESWEVDLLCHPEKGIEKDLMDQRNSGVDEVILKLMAEHGIGIEFNLSQILNSYGMTRAQVIGRMRQNIVLARKYGVSMILTSGASECWGLRSPQDMIAVAEILGMNQAEAKASVSDNPLKLIKKSKDRKNPDIITSGLEVISWGKQPKKQKNRYGWY